MNVYTRRETNQVAPTNGGLDYSVALESLAVWKERDGRPTCSISLLASGETNDIFALDRDSGC